jgi:phosphatidylinositol alpha-mannosyltransferase
MILTEAMAAGTPVAASDLEAFRRVLDDAGALFRAGSDADLTSVLADLLDDPARRSAMVARGREVVAPYDWEEISRRVLEVYQLAREAAPRRPRAAVTTPARRWLPSRRG